MKIRVSQFYSLEDFGISELRGLFGPKLEGAINFPIVISNNECSAKAGFETPKDDSPISFILKFKASFTSPMDPPGSLLGVSLPKAGFQNLNVNDGLAKFNSVNENHFDMQIDDSNQFDLLIIKTLQLQNQYHRFDFSDVASYLRRNLNDPEWQARFAGSKSWNKLKNKILVQNFKSTHCEFEEAPLLALQKYNKVGFMQDLQVLRDNSAVTDSNILKLLHRLFPAIF
jgi:hypothetical protein